MQERLYKFSLLGFTLIELMIVVSILAILIGISYPNYTKQIASARRTEAKTSLLGYAMNFEDYYGTNYTYTGADTYYGLNSNPKTPNNYYTLSASITNSGGGYLLTATAAGTQAADTSCAVMSIDQNGLQTPTTGCW